MEFVKNFTPPDFQAKNFTPSISPNFNSFRKKNTKNEWKWKNLHRWQKFYTAAGSDGMDKFHLWIVSFLSTLPGTLHCSFSVLLQLTESLHLFFLDPTFFLVDSWLHLFVTFYHVHCAVQDDHVKMVLGQICVCVPLWVVEVKTLSIRVWDKLAVSHAIIVTSLSPQLILILG